MKKAINIGSSSKNDFVIGSKYVADLHARIVVDGNQVVIEDFDSVFGTHVNGRKITVPTTLSMKDKVKIGVHLLDWQNIVFKESEEEKRKSNPIYLKDLFNWQGKLSWEDYRIVLLLVFGISILMPFVVPTFLGFVGLQLYEKGFYPKSIFFDILEFSPFLLFLIYTLVGFIFFNLTIKFIRGLMGKDK